MRKGEVQVGVAGQRFRVRADGVYEIVRPGVMQRVSSGSRRHNIFVALGDTLLAVPLAAALGSLLPGVILEVPPLALAVGLAIVLKLVVDRRRSRPPLRVIRCT